MSDDTQATTLTPTPGSLEHAVRFILDSVQIKMSVPSQMLGANGQPMATVLNGPLMFFYEKAVKSGKSSLQQLTLEDFTEEIAHARAVPTGPSSLS